MVFSITPQNGNLGPTMWPYVQPPIIDSFWFENFDVVKRMAWLERNWTISIYISAVYILIIFAGKHIMKNRQPFIFSRTFSVWNLGFTIFSIVGLLRCLPELVIVLNGNNGFHRSVCVRDSHNEPGAFWAWVFTLSKIVELGDTVFIVLRKEPLLFVHYFHHSVALMATWYFYSFYVPIDRYIGICNYFCHSVLYGYMFFKSIGMKMPKILAKMVMLVEMLQLIVGVLLNSYASWVKVQGQPCEHRTDSIILQFMLYLLFVIVFGYHFTLSKKQREGLKKNT